MFGFLSSSLLSLSSLARRLATPTITATPTTTTAETPTTSAATHETPRVLGKRPADLVCRGRGDDDVLIEDATDDEEDDDNEQRRNPHFGRVCSSRADAGVATSISDLYFQRNIERLEYYQKAHGQGKFPPYTEAGAVSRWIYVQQLMARPEGHTKDGTIYHLSAVRREQLEALGVPFGALPGMAAAQFKCDDAEWDIKFEELKTFHEREGRWPSRTSKQAQKNPEEKTIGLWIDRQRTAQRTGKGAFHGSSRQQRLLAIGAIRK
jgi:hypothetical protein